MYDLTWEKGLGPILKFGGYLNYVGIPKANTKQIHVLLKVEEEGRRGSQRVPNKRRVQHRTALEQRREDPVLRPVPGNEGGRPAPGSGFCVSLRESMDPPGKSRDQ